MEKIQHNNIKVNGINMHVAEIGEGPAVLFVHGFPELWYTWRHQMLFIASKGYRAIAPDLHPTPFSIPQTKTQCSPYKLQTTPTTKTNMEKIQHNNIKVNGINMHVAEIGEGPVVLFIHGFPELWYTWRHQMLFIASKGYRAIAPDLRGFGDTEAPPSATSYTAFHIVGDLVCLLDSLGLDKVYLVGHDWGAIIAWHLCMFRPERIKALVNMSVVYKSRHPSVKPVELMRQIYGDDFYVCRFQEIGWEEEFAKVDTKKLLATFYFKRIPTPPKMPKDFANCFNPPPYTLPAWFTEEDLDYFASKYRATGFSGPFNYYRCFDLNWELCAAWIGSKIMVPVKFIVGDIDLMYNFPGIREYIHGGEFKEAVPQLEQVVVMEGVGHFINQEKPQEINDHIYDFITKF